MNDTQRKLIGPEIYCNERKSVKKSAKDQLDEPKKVDISSIPID